MTAPESTPPPFVPYVAGPVAPDDLRPAVPAGSAPPGRPFRPVLFAAAGLLLGLVLGAGVTYVAARSSKPSPAAAAEPTTVYVTQTVEVRVPATTSPTAVATTSTAPPPPPPPVIDNGTWTVGEDIPAGTYKVTAAGPDCFWSIFKSGTNQHDIIQNHIGGGNLRVTLKAGQDFETDHCGVWEKTG